MTSTYGPGRAENTSLPRARPFPPHAVASMLLAMPDPLHDNHDLGLLARALDLSRTHGTWQKRFAIDREIDDEPTMRAMRIRLEEMVEIAGTDGSDRPYSQALAAHVLADAVLEQLDRLLLGLIDDACARSGITASMVQRCLDTQQRDATRQALLRVRRHLPPSTDIPN